MRLTRALAAFLCVLVLQSCGGGGGGDGGGGGGGGGGSRFTITLDRSTIGFTFVEGSPPPTVVIHATAQGEYTGNLYVAATLEGSGISPNIPIIVSGTSANIMVTGAEGLTAGTYTGRINFMACSDPGCTVRVGGTPIPVAFNVTVSPGTRLNPTSLALNAQSGAGTSAEVSVQLPSGQDTYTLQIPATTLNWLTVPAKAASSFTVTARSMPAGIYTATVSATSGTSTFNLPVTYTVTAPPSGSLSTQATPATLTMSASEGGQDVRTLSVLKPTWNPDSLNASIFYTGDATGWLSTTPVTGGFSITASAASLAQGAYGANILIRTDPVNEADSIVVPLTFTVGPGLIQPAPRTLTIGSDAPDAAPTSSVRIDAMDLSASAAWVATSDQPWLVLTRASGQTGTDVQFNIDLATLKTWAPTSDHSAKIHVAGSTSNITPVDIDVIVQMRLAEIIGVGPSVLVAGQSQRVVIRGRNFSVLDSPISRLRIDGLGAPLTATRINDTKIIADFGVVGHGPHTVSVTNGLNRVTSTAPVHVIPAGTYVYKAIPITENQVRGPFIYDPLNQNAYVNTESSSRLLRIPLGSSAVQPLGQGPYSLGIAANGTDFLAAEPLSVSQLDAATFAILPETTISFIGLSLSGPPPNGDQGLVISNDSRLWFESHRALDLKAKTVSTVTLAPDVPGNPGSYSPGAVSRDGERVIGLEVPAPLFQAVRFTWVDAADSVLHRSSAAYQIYPAIGVNDDGKRVMAGYYSVLDENLDLVGNITLPASASAYDPHVSAISPDGSRVYLVTYPRANYNNPTPDPALKSRVYVFDSSTPVSNAPHTLPVLGYVDLDDEPSCLNSNCFSPIYARVTPDGGALLIVSNRNFLVVPTNESMLQPASAPSGPGTQSAIRTTVWRLQGSRSAQ